MCLKMISIFVIVLTIHWTKCETTCDLIQTNKRYNGLKLRHMWVDKVSKYRFYTKGKEWKFYIKTNEKGNLYVESNPSVTHIEKDYIQEFDVWGKMYGEDFWAEFVAKCNVKSLDSTAVEIYCRTDSDWPTVEDTEKKILRLRWTNNMVVFNTPNPSNWAFGLAKTTGRVDYYEIRYHRNWGGEDSLFILIRHEVVDCPGCIPEFIQRPIDRLLLKQLEGIVAYRLNSRLKGHLLWFNINDRPMYCFTPEGQPLSQQCKSSQNMIPFMSECFYTPTPSTTPTPTTELIDWWVPSTTPSNTSSTIPSNTLPSTLSTTPSATLSITSSTTPLTTSSTVSTEDNKLWILWILVFIALIIAIIAIIVVIVYDYNKHKKEKVKTLSVHNSRNNPLVIGRHSRHNSHLSSSGSTYVTDSSFSRRSQDATTKTSKANKISLKSKQMK